MQSLSKRVVVADDSRLMRRTLPDAVGRGPRVLPLDELAVAIAREAGA